MPNPSVPRAAACTHGVAMFTMNAVNIRDLDLNLLLVFEAVAQTRSMTAAGRRLGQAQPTVSHALARLRRLCGDPLFVRTRTGVEPTPYAERLIGPITHALDTVRAGFARELPFEPATSERVFTVLLSDVGQAAFLPQLTLRLATEAPNAALVAAEIPRAAYREALEAGRADLAVGGLGFLRTGFYRRGLFVDRYVCCVCARSRAAREGLTLDDYLAGRHVGVISPGLPDDGVEHALLSTGRGRRFAVKVPHFLVAPTLVRGTDLIATVPSRALRGLEASGDIAVLEPPVPTAPIDVGLYWHERLHGDDGNRWLRGLVTSLFADAPERRG